MKRVLHPDDVTDGEGHFPDLDPVHDELFTERSDSREAIVNLDEVNQYYKSSKKSLSR